MGSRSCPKLIFVDFLSLYFKTTFLRQYLQNQIIRYGIFHALSHNTRRPAGERCSDGPFKSQSLEYFLNAFPQMLFRQAPKSPTYAALRRSRPAPSAPAGPRCLGRCRDAASRVEPVRRRAGGCSQCRRGG